MERRAAALLEEAEETAAARLREAEEQVQQLLERASAEAEAVREEARRAGFEAGRTEGYSAGLAEGRTEAEACLRQARAEAEQLRAAAREEREAARAETLQERARMLDEAKQEILSLALTMARQILKAELALRPEAVVPMLEAALAKMKGEDRPGIRVSPEVVAVIEEHRARLLAAIPGARQLEVEADLGLEPGDFVVQGSQGYVNGRVDRQVSALEEQILPEER